MDEQNEKITDQTQCAIIGDLLPLYAEDMLSPTSKQAVIDHLAECEACRSRYAQMRNASLLPDTSANQQAAKPLRRFRWHIFFNILGAPIWLPLLIVACAVIFVLYLCIWVVDISLWCVPVSLGAAGLGTAFLAVLALFQGQGAASLLCLAAGMICAGLALLAAFPCVWFSRAIVKMTAFFWRKLTGRYRKEIV